MSSSESYFAVQVERVTEDAMVAELADQTIRLIEAVQRFDARAERVAAIRAGHRPPRRLSRRLFDDLDRIGELLGECVAATDELRRGDNP